MASWRCFIPGCPLEQRWQRAARGEAETESWRHYLHEHFEPEGTPVPSRRGAREAEKGAP